MARDRGKLVVVGLDGMPYRLIEHLSSTGVMPNTQALIRKGTFRPMESSIPEVSSVAWSSIITGVNPGRHGIFGFSDVPEGTYRLTFPNFTNLRSDPFWDQENRLRSVILNVPSTYPARAMNGVLVSGFVALDLKRSVHPPEVLDTLSNMGYKVDVDSDKGHRSMDLFIKDLNATLEARIAAYRHFWDSEEWNTFMLVFTGTDRLGHFLWDAYEEESHRYHDAFLDHLRRIDQVVGEVMSKISGNDTLVMLSDHGFESSEVEVNVSRILVDEGFLKLRCDPPRSLADIEEGTRAFALDPARIYLNVEGKYPRGSVKTADYGSVVRDLVDLFSSLELVGGKIARKVCTREEIYEGPHAWHGPDLVVVGNRGWDLKSGLKAREKTKPSTFKGKHTQDDAFLLVNCESTAMPEKPRVDEVVTIVREITGRMPDVRNS